jgi:cytochrome c
MKHLIVTIALLAQAPAGWADEFADGKRVFKKCKACHQVGPEAKNRVGPSLDHIIGTHIGVREGFKYSKAFNELAESDEVWSRERLSEFLENPKKNIPGTKMSFRGLSKEKDRDAVIDYLASFGETEGNTVPHEDMSDVPAALLAIEGDVEYGEYLGSECTTCHQASGTDDGIPAITGWPADVFAGAMYHYRIGLREHPVMEMIARRLSDDEIAALAAYFKTLQ